jgi:type II secretory pathway pseudopilin PulG
MQRKGFTLVELIIVIFIIIVLALLASITAEHFIKKALIVKTKFEVRQLYIAMKQLQLDTQQWPERSYDVNQNPDSPDDSAITCDIPIKNFRAPNQPCVPPVEYCDLLCVNPPSLYCQNGETLERISSCLDHSTDPNPTEYSHGLGNIAGNLNDPTYTGLNYTWMPSLWGGLTGNPGRRSCNKDFIRTCTVATQATDCPGAGDTCYSGSYLDDMNPYLNWKGPYIKKAMYDGWDRPYFASCDYKIPGTSDTYAFAVGSVGPDGKMETADDITIYTSTITQASTSC